jgi:excisionase family DNA binding protein
VAATYSSAHHLPYEQSKQNKEWLDLKALTQYASVSERTVRQWIHRAANPLPAVRVHTKILVRRSAFDQWLESHRLATIDVACIVDEMVSDLVGMN